MDIKLFCRKHYRRAVPYIPMLVPTMAIEIIECAIHYRVDLVYQPKCPVCWDNDQREKVFKDFEEKHQNLF